MDWLELGGQPSLSPSASWYPNLESLIFLVSFRHRCRPHFPYIGLWASSSLHRCIQCALLNTLEKDPKVYTGNQSGLRGLFPHHDHSLSSLMIWMGATIKAMLATCWRIFSNPIKVNHQPFRTTDSKYFFVKEGTSRYSKSILHQI